MNAIRSAMGATFLGLCLAAGGAYAQSGASQSGMQTNDQIDAQHRSDRKKCENLSGNEKDVCEKQADARRDSAEADTRQAKKQSEARHEAAQEKRDAGYDVAKEKCDAMSGDAKDKCMTDAKTRFGK